MRTLILLLLLLGPALACINEYEPRGQPSLVFGDYDEIDWQNRVKELAGRDDYRSRNDYAAALMRVKRAPEAVEVLVGVERQHPGEYIVAANLGTAYELSGNLPQALRWIEEGIRRNPEAHQGTEWLHVRILEARSQLASDPEWLKWHRVLTQADLADGVRLEKALRYQLHERMWFVKPPDPVVGDLLLVRAERVDQPGRVQEAAEMYQLALSYQPQQGGDAAARRRDELAGQVRTGQKLETGGLMAVLACLGVIGVMLALQKVRA